MIRIAICDDNRNDAQDTKSLLLSFMEENAAAAYQVKVFSSAAQLLASMSSEPPYHLYLLDILMPDRNGIDLGREIHNYNPSSLVIYLSSSPEDVYKRQMPMPVKVKSWPPAFTNPAPGPGSALKPPC